MTLAGHRRPAGQGDARARLRRPSSARSACGGGPTAFRLHPARSGALSFEPGEGGRLIETLRQRQGVRDRQDPRLGAAAPAGVRLAPGDASRPIRTPRSRSASRRSATETRVTVEHTGWDSRAAGARRPARLPRRHLPDAAWRMVANPARRRTRTSWPKGMSVSEQATRDGSAPAPRPPAAFGFIFATAVMNAVSFGLMIPVLPNLIRSFFGATTRRPPPRRPTGSSSSASPGARCSSSPGRCWACCPTASAAGR